MGKSGNPAKSNRRYTADEVAQMQKGYENRIANQVDIINRMKNSTLEDKAALFGARAAIVGLAKHIDEIDETPNREPGVVFLSTEAITQSEYKDADVLYGEDGITIRLARPTPDPQPEEAPK